MTERPGGAPFINGLPQSVIDRYEATQKTAAKTAERSLKQLADDGYCTDEWSRWHQGMCGTYAESLVKHHPHLRFGVMGESDDPDDPDTDVAFNHFFAHDDTHAYDAGGKHPLPYHGVHGDNDHVELDSDPKWFGPFESEEGADEQDYEDAADHARRNGILEGRYGPKG